MKREAFAIESFEPAYLRLSESDWRKRVQQAVESLRCCMNCPRQCRADRLANETGVCETGRYAFVSSAFAHHGEEDCLSGSSGSGTIFFGSCNLRCGFCQNGEISQEIYGAPYPPGMLADLMIELQGLGCHNINFVTPAHVTPQIVEAMAEAVPKGLNLPLVYNTSGYDSIEALSMMDGLIDIYMPDFKFWRPETAERLCGAPDYPERAREALREMHRQVGPLTLGPGGLARRGLLVRHLVMPGQTAESAAILQWIAKELSTDTFVNIMGQYRPAHRALTDTGLRIPQRRVTPKEMETVYAAARQAGLWRFARPC